MINFNVVWQRLVNGASSVWRVLVVDRLFTTVACVLSLFIVLALPQVSNLLWQLPPLHFITSSDWGFYLQFYLYVIGVIGLFAFLSWALIPRRNPVGGRGAIVAESLIRPVEARVRLGAGRAGVVLLLVGVIWVAVGVTADDSSPLSWFRRKVICGLLMGGFGLWLCVAAGWPTVRAVLRRPRGPAPVEGTQPVGRLGYRMNIAGRALSLLTLVALIDLFVWHLPGWFPNQASFRTYTIWAVFEIVFLLIGAGPGDRRLAPRLAIEHPGIGLPGLRATGPDGPWPADRPGAQGPGPAVPGAPRGVQERARAADLGPQERA